MMKLVQNELIKLIKQTSTKVLLIIIAALMILSPVLSFFLNKAIDIGYTKYRRLDYIYDDAQITLEKSDNQMLKAAAQTQIDIVNFYRNNKFNEESWQYNYIFENYYSYKINACGLELILAGNDAWDVIFDGAYGEFYGLSSDPNSPYSAAISNCDYDTVIIYDEAGRECGEKYVFRVTEGEIRSGIEKFKQKISDLENGMISDNSQIAVEMIRSSINEAKIQYEEQAKYLESLDEDKLNNQYRADIFKTSVEYYTDLIKVLDIVIREGNGIDDWRISLFERMQVILDLEYYINSSVIMPKDLYAETHYYHTNQELDIEYEEMCKQAEENRKHYDETVKVLMYAAENDIVFSALSESPAKSEWRNNLSSAFSIVLIFAIVITSQIMSREYSTGTIRMLVIRPRKRHKIVTSKILAMGILILTAMVGAIVIEGGIGLIINGTGDLFVPDLAIVGGEIVEIPAVLTFLKIFVFAFLTIAFYSSLAYMFSIILKHSAVAITLSVLVFIAASSIQGIIFSLSYYTDVEWAKFTVLPYLDLRALGDTVSDYLSYCMNMSSGITLSASYYDVYEQFPPIIGTVIIVVHTAIFTFLSYLIFIKKQIKS